MSAPKTFIDNDNNSYRHDIGPTVATGDQPATMGKAYQVLDILIKTVTMVVLIAILAILVLIMNNLNNPNSNVNTSLSNVAGSLETFIGMLQDNNVRVGTFAVQD